MSAITNPLTSAPNTSSATTSTASSSDALTSEQTFLQLLIAQIKNQDPTTPTDPVQFVTQLTQYSELEQLIGINQGVGQLDTSVTTPPKTTPTT